MSCLIVSEVDRHWDGTLPYQNTGLQTASRKVTCVFEAPLLDTWESLKSPFLLLCGWRRCSRSFQLSRSMMTSVSMVVRLGSCTCVTIVAVLDASRPIALGTRRLSLVSWISSMMVVFFPLALLPLRPLPPLRLVCRLGTLPISAPCLSPYCLCSSCAFSAPHCPCSSCACHSCSLARCCSYCF